MGKVDQNQMPWVVVGPCGVYWLGLAQDEKHAWEIALGWPSQSEIADCKRTGWYAASASLTWKRGSND